MSQLIRTAIELDCSKLAADYAQICLCTCSCLGSEGASASAPRSARVRSLTCRVQPYVSSRTTTLSTAGFSCWVGDSGRLVAPALLFAAQLRVISDECVNSIGMKPGLTRMVVSTYRKARHPDQPDQRDSELAISCASP